MYQTLLKTNSIIDIIVSRKLAANEQLNRTPAVLRIAIGQRFNANSNKIKYKVFALSNKQLKKKQKEILRKDTQQISEAEAVVWRCSVKKVS